MNVNGMPTKQAQSVKDRHINVDVTSLRRVDVDLTFYFINAQITTICRIGNLQESWCSVKGVETLSMPRCSPVCERFEIIQG